MKNEHELGAAIAGMRDPCVSLDVDFDLGPETDALASLVSGSPSSDDEDGFISVVLDSDTATGRAALVDSNAEDLPDPSAAQAKSAVLLPAPQQQSFELAACCPNRWRPAPVEL